MLTEITINLSQGNSADDNIQINIKNLSAENLNDCVKNILNYKGKIRYLSLENNRLEDIGSEKLIWFFNEICEAGIHRLSLKSNSLYELSGEALVTVVTAIGNAGIKKLNLASNVLYKLDEISVDEFMESIEKIYLVNVVTAAGEAGIKSLNLSSNGFHRLGATGIIEMLKAAGEAGIKNLSLTNNDLHLLGVENTTEIATAAGKAGIKNFKLTSNTSDTFNNPVAPPTPFTIFTNAATTADGGRTNNGDEGDARINLRRASI